MMFGTGDDDSEYWLQVFQQKILNKDVGFPTHLWSQDNIRYQIHDELESILRGTSKEDIAFLKNVAFEPEEGSPVTSKTADEGNRNWNRPIPAKGEPSSKSKLSYEANAQDCWLSNKFSLSRMAYDANMTNVSRKTDNAQMACDNISEQNRKAPQTLWNDNISMASNSREDIMSVADCYTLDTNCVYCYTFNDDVNVITEQHFEDHIERRNSLKDCNTVNHDRATVYSQKVSSTYIERNNHPANLSAHNTGDFLNSSPQTTLQVECSSNLVISSNLSRENNKMGVEDSSITSDLSSGTSFEKDRVSNETSTNVINDSRYSVVHEFNTLGTSLDATDVDLSSIQNNRLTNSEWSLNPSVLALNVNWHNQSETGQAIGSDDDQPIPNDIQPEDTTSDDVDWLNFPTPEVNRKCPIEDCNITKCHLSKQNNTEPSFWLWRVLNRAKRGILNVMCLDTSPFDKTRSVHVAMFKGTDLSRLQRRQGLYDVKKKNVDLARDPKDFEQFLDNIHFELPLAKKIQDENPFVKFQNYLGLRGKPFPKHPLHGGTMSNFMSELRRLVVRAATYVVFLVRRCLKDGVAQRYRLRTGMRVALLSSYMGFVENSLFLTGKEAYRFYRMLVSVEIECLTDDLLREREMVLKHYKWKHDTLMHIVMLARDYYQHPTDSKRYEWKRLKKLLPREHASNTDLRYNVSQLPFHKSVFSSLVMLTQVVFLLVVLAVDGFATVGLEGHVTVLHNVSSFSGSHTVRHHGDFNPWIGPSRLSFLNAGAVFGPCLRKAYFNKKKEYSRFVAPLVRNYGCCTIKVPFLTFGTTTHQECLQWTLGNGSWIKGSPCSTLSMWSNNVEQPDQSAAIKPCCVGLKGKCLMVTKEHCAVLDGIFNDQCDHCASVNCLGLICHLHFLDNPLKADPNAPWRLEDSGWKQKHRIVFSLFSSHGVLSLVPFLALEATTMTTLEHYIGWHRVAIIYVVSSIAAMLSQLSFETDHFPITGTQGGAMGVLGVVILEWTQAWNLLPHPWLEALKLAVPLGLFLFLATFPMISFNAIATGLVTGAIVGLMVVPYMTFNRYLGPWRGRLVVLSFLLLVHLFITLIIFTFYLHTTPFCNLCVEVECLPYKAHTCKNLQDL